MAKWKAYPAGHKVYRIKRILPVVILYILSEPLMEVLYHSTSGAVFIQIMAPFILLYYLQSPFQSVLQALNLANAAMINSLIGACVKLVIIFALASNPAFGINGVAIGIITSFVLVTFCIMPPF